jgi:hypothetical protein
MQSSAGWERVMLRIRTKVPAIFYLYVIAFVAMSVLALSRISLI